MGWQAKVVRLAILGRVPFGESLRKLKRRLFGYEPNPGNIDRTLENMQSMKRVLAEGDKSIQGARILEIGSGWFPAIPIMFLLDGARKVLLTDLNRHMDSVTFEATVKHLRGLFPENQGLKKIKHLADLPLTYLAPFDPSTLSNASIDIVISRTVLEHIPPADIVTFLSALRPKMAPGGVMAHYVDHSDHFEHIDKSISRINFLTWSDSKHRMINTLTKEGENRLRHHQYEALFREAGYSVIASIPELHQATVEAAKTLKMVAPFDTMSPEQLAVMGTTFLLTPASA